jgi:large subunit ribosomal protein L23
MAEIQNVLIKPIITEKSSFSANENNTYVFQVGLTSNKVQIKQAVETFFGVQVDSVRTLVVRGKIKRFGRFQGKRSNWKKAYVKLSNGHSIESLRG